MDPEETMRTLLDAAVQFQRAHRVDPLEQGNLFTVLDMESKEVSAHSAFLYFVFQPFLRGDDTRDDAHLRELLALLLRAKRQRYGGAPQDPDAYRDLEIRREVQVDFGRLDFVVTADREIFVIELKVWAGEQEEQIPRYRQYLLQQGADARNLFFLTPVPRPSETGESVNLTLQGDLKPVLQTIASRRRAQGHATYAAMLEQYLAVIEKLTGENTMKESLNVIQTAEELQAVELLVENRTRRLQAILEQFFLGLKERLGDLLAAEGGPRATAVPRAAFAYGYRSIETYYRAPNCYPALAYEIEPFPLRAGCRLKDGVRLYFFIEANENLYCGITPRIPDETGLQGVACEEAIQPYPALLDALKTTKKTGHTRTFAIWEHLTIGQRKINFTLRKLRDQTGFLRLLRAHSLTLDDRLMEELATAVKRKYAAFCQAIFEE